MQYTDDQLREALPLSLSYSQLLIRLGKQPKGGNYRILKRKILELGLDTSHLTGKVWNKGKKTGPSKTALKLEDFLKRDRPCSSDALKKKLIKAGVFEHKCTNCSGTEWLGLPIPLELEHIDGDHDNNELSNLTLLCPNCHALTKSYRGKNKRRYDIAPLVQPAETADLNPAQSEFESQKEHQSKHREKKHYFCNCGTKVHSSSKQCIKCFNVSRTTKIEWPSITELHNKVTETSYLAVAKELGVSDNAIRKRLRAFGIND